MNDDDPPPSLESDLESLRSEHRALDARIRDLTSEPGYNQLEIARLKKRKLRLKDLIQQLLDLTTPDIIA